MGQKWGEQALACLKKASKRSGVRVKRRKGRGEMWGDGAAAAMGKDFIGVPRVSPLRQRSLIPHGRSVPSLVY